MIEPVSKNHSVKEAVITLFLATPLIKPERYEGLIDTPFFKNQFHKYENIRQFNINFPINNNPFEQQALSIGFRLIRYEAGKNVVAFQGVNEKARQFLSYHNLKYTRWNDFYMSFKEVFKSFALNSTELFITGFSLHYVDEFILRNQVFKNDMLFNLNSELLPADFFKSSLRNYIYTTIKKERYEYIDRFEIKLSERIKNTSIISISHNATQNLRESTLLSELLDSSLFDDMMLCVHAHNKKTLKDVLNKNICDLIHLS